MTHIENLRQAADTMDHIADLAASGELGYFEHLVCTGGGCNEIGHELRAAADEMGRLAAEAERLRGLIASPAVGYLLRYGYKQWDQTCMPDGADYADILAAYEAHKRLQPPSPAEVQADA